jgi:hypothetical protein
LARRFAAALQDAEPALGCFPPGCTPGPFSNPPSEPVSFYDSCLRGFRFFRFVCVYEETLKRSGVGIEGFWQGRGSFASCGASSSGDGGPVSGRSCDYDSPGWTGAGWLKTSSTSHQRCSHKQIKSPHSGKKGLSASHVPSKPSSNLPRPPAPKPETKTNRAQRASAT